MSSPKQKAADLLKALETGDTNAFAYIDPKNYIQHNLELQDGLAGLQAFQKSVAGKFKTDTRRVFRDGDFVFTHSNYTVGGDCMAGLDVFRFEKGLIVEQWDNLQKNTHIPNTSGRTMLDGPTELTDLDKTEANRQLVIKYVDSLVKEPWESKYLDDNVHQHNPLLADGVAGFVKGLTTLAQSGYAVKYTNIFKVLAEGNFVLVMALGTLGPNPIGIYDLFRLEGGKIVENWDTVQAIPSPYLWQNSNGKF